MNGGARCWASFPADALAYVINEGGLCHSDIASIRLVCVHWRATTNGHLKSLAPACSSLEQVASIAQRFPFLTNCDLTRCDTRLVGHASLCRDASAHLSSLLAALSRMPSLTALHISDTFSERMGQKHWASLVCAQALVNLTQPSESVASIEVRPGLPYMDAGGAGMSGGGAVATVVDAAAATTTSPVSVSTVASVGNALAAVSVSATHGSGGRQRMNLSDRLMAENLGMMQSRFGPGGRRGDGDGDGIEVEVDEGDVDRSGSASPPPAEGHSGAAAATAAAAALTATAGVADRRAHDLDAAQGTAQQMDPSGGDDTEQPPPDHYGHVVPEQEPYESVSAVLARRIMAAAAPPPLFLNAAELADPGIKSFARAISRPGATHQHAFWLPDWCGRLAGLQELHIRGRQRPTAGLPPCLLWLHAGRTAPLLTSLSLVRLSLVTLPEQLQYLTGLTRLVAQDCSLSLMPRGLSALSRLQYMDLSMNGLTALPADFTQLTALKHLELQRNKLVALPADIGRLCNLTCLLVNNNQLRQLPASMSAMRNVEVLSCSYNWLGGMGTSLPLLCNLPRLKKLELACVSDVRCRLVQPQELRFLSHLTHLDLASNNLVPADVIGEWYGRGADVIGEWYGRGADVIGEWYGRGADVIGEWYGRGADVIGEWYGRGADVIGEWYGRGPDVIGEWYGRGADGRLVRGG
ncbi:hypothetical protein Vretimale_17523 [Volvox reticuliferus]|uniref:Uncharacterized protein n=1 Tax=Volvox reticuliferus TaxID=1737510 RepID=A0A8J4GV98_9CHLO|nr:hypothetical protein Vretifemale_18177 [Volvox reticuliferus]GIM14600.1 hypothetical protein Vretimale_17523 [Volvox reticuliferus]